MKTYKQVIEILGEMAHNQYELGNHHDNIPESLVELVSLIYEIKSHVVYDDINRNCNSRFNT